MGLKRISTLLFKKVYLYMAHTEQRVYIKFIIKDTTFQNGASGCNCWMLAQALQIKKNDTNVVCI